MDSPSSWAGVIFNVRQAQDSHEGMGRCGDGSAVSLQRDLWPSESFLFVAAMAAGIQAFHLFSRDWQSDS